MEARIDLHVHSNCSDGTYTPEELVLYALRKGLSAFALTDHDTVDGVRRAQQAASGTSLKKYVGDHAPCFVPQEQISPFEAVRLLLDNGAHPVLAHPLLYHLGPSELENLVDQLCVCGLQGLEAVYSTNRFSDESAMKQLALRHGLCVAGGSDFHGSNKPDIDLGTGHGNLNIPCSLWEKLRGCS